MKLNTITAFLASVLLAVATLATAGTIQTVTVKQVAALQSRGVLLLDVRELDEYEELRAPGSTLIPLGQLQQRLSEIEDYKKLKVAVICRSGNRSAQAIKLLEGAGFSGAVNVEGGMNAWQKAGLPVLSGKSAR